MQGLDSKYSLLRTTHLSSITLCSFDLKYKPIQREANTSLFDVW